VICGTFLLGRLFQIVQLGQLAQKEIRIDCNRNCLKLRNEGHNSSDDSATTS
jgi:hypothetical protein